MEGSKWIELIVSQRFLDLGWAQFRPISRLVGAGTDRLSPARRQGRDW
jgi:hypothetical protein